MMIVVATTAIVGSSSGKHDPPEHLELVGAVDAGRLEQLGADALEPGRQDDHGEAGQQPDPDDDEERSCSTVASMQPRDRIAAGRRHDRVERPDVRDRART